MKLSYDKKLHFFCGFLISLLTGLHNPIYGLSAYEIYDTAYQAGVAPPKARILIHTLEGDHEAKVGDYIIKGVQGEFYPCKPEIFVKTYEAVEGYPTCNESTRRDMELSRKTHREF